MKKIFFLILILTSINVFAKSNCDLEVKAFSYGQIYSLDQLKDPDLKKFYNKDRVSTNNWQECFQEASLWALELYKQEKIDFHVFINGFFLYYGVNWEFARFQGQVNPYTAKYFFNRPRQGEFLFDVFGQKLSLGLDQRE